MAGTVETLAFATDVFIPFEQVHQKVKQLLTESTAAKEKGKLKESQKLLIEAWKVTIKDIETRTL